jgi:hypothetical protein
MQRLIEQEGLRLFKDHLQPYFFNGFISNYICWTSHGEKGVIMEDNEEEDCDDNFPGHAGFGAFDDDTAMVLTASKSHIVRQLLGNK